MRTYKGIPSYADLTAERDTLKTALAAEKRRCAQLGSENRSYVFEIRTLRTRLSDYDEYLRRVRDGRADGFLFRAEPDRDTASG